MKNLGDKIFPYTRLELERNVNALLLSLPGTSDSSPVAVGVILEKVPGYLFTHPVALLAQDLETEAMVMTPTHGHRCLVVVIDWGIMNQRDQAPCRMALAEEIGHMHLHRAVMLDINSVDDFLDIQEHPNWDIAERDAKFWARALLIPGHLLEPVSQMIYKRVARELGFRDLFHFSAVFTTHLATAFEIPPEDAQKRIDQYVGDLRGRIERSVATRSDELFGMNDTAIALRREHQPTLTGMELFGESD
jgi:AraC-like DNA-binding protein